MYIVETLNYRHLQMITVCKYRAWQVQAGTRKTSGKTRLTGEIFRKRDGQDIDR
jgi:hypothetical protein